MDKKTRESIEACRPASDDLRAKDFAADMADAARQVQSDPQVRLFHERVQKWDTSIGRAMDEVTVPPGLAERILERLAGNSPLLAGSVASAAQIPVSTGEIGVAAAPRAKSWSRRRWAGAGVAAILVGVLAVAANQWLGQASELPIEDLADQWHQRLGAKWEQVATAPPKYPIPDSIRVMATRWQWVDRLTAVPVAAYELAHEKAGQAMLYVAGMKRDGLPSAPPLKPQSNTGGHAVAYWQSGGRVYVLVVDDERSYREFVRPSTTPIAYDAGADRWLALVA